MARGTYFGHVTEHVTLELSSLAGRDVHLGRTMWAGADGRYDVMTECPEDEPAESAVPAHLLELAIATVKNILLERHSDLPVELARITRVVERERLGVSTAALAAAARRRGIPVRRVGQLSMLRLGYGRYRRLVCAALTEQTSVIGVDIAADKMLAKQLLSGAGIPVPDGVVAWSAADAAEALDRLGGPLVIKPRNGNHGVNVTVGVTTAADAAEAYARTAAAGPRDRGDVRARHGLPGAGRRRPGGGRVRAAPGLGDRRWRLRHRQARRRGECRPAPGRGPLPRADQDQAR